MKEDVRIQLDAEPQLHSPLRTAVGTAPQAYTFFFREPMDRLSVEAAIRQHAKDAPAVHFVEPALSFHWVHDRQLRVLAVRFRGGRRILQHLHLLGILFPLMMGLLTSLNPTIRGTISSLANSVMYAAATLGSWIAGLLYAAFHAGRRSRSRSRCLELEGRIATVRNWRLNFTGKGMKANVCLLY